MKKLYRWIIMVIIPLALSLYLFNPFSAYIITDKFFINESVPQTPNTYRFQIGELNSTEVDNQLIGSYIEQIFNIFIRYKKYNLFFKDNYIINKPKQMDVTFTLTTKDGIIEVKRFGSKKIMSNINLNENYEVNLSISNIPNIKYADIYINNKSYYDCVDRTCNFNEKGVTMYLNQINESGVTTFVMSTGDEKTDWIVKKSKFEYLLKTFIFILLWNLIIVAGLEYMYSKLIKKA